MGLVKGCKSSAPQNKEPVMPLGDQTEEEKSGSVVTKIDKKNKVPLKGTRSHEVIINDLYLRKATSTIATLGPIYTSCMILGCPRPIADIFGARCFKTFNEQVFLCQNHLDHFGRCSCLYVVDNSKFGRTNIIVRRGPENHREHRPNNSSSKKKLFITKLISKVESDKPAQNLNETIKELKCLIETSTDRIYEGLDSLGEKFLQVHTQLQNVTSRVQKLENEVKDSEDSEQRGFSDLEFSDSD